MSKPNKRRKKPWKRWQRRWKEGWVEEMHTPRARRNAAFDMLVFDHGLLRKAWRNLDEIAPGVWRSSQPDPAMLRRMARDGLKAVLNLRGPTLYGSYLLERETCREIGLELVDFPSTSRSLPSRESIQALDAIFARLPRPFLMHCKSGADRAGFAAALYLLLHGEADPEAVRRQLSWRYLHVRGGATGVLHALLAAYEADRAATGIGFRDWVATRYDPAVISAGYHGNGAAGFLVDRVLRRE